MQGFTSGSFMLKCSSNFSLSCCFDMLPVAQSRPLDSIRNICWYWLQFPSCRIRSCTSYAATSMRRVRAKVEWKSTRGAGGYVSASPDLTSNFSRINSRSCATEKSFNVLSAALELKRSSKLYVAWTAGWHVHGAHFPARLLELQHAENFRTEGARTGPRNVDGPC